MPALRQEVTRLFGLEAKDYSTIDFDQLSSAEIDDTLWERVENTTRRRKRSSGRELMRRVERDIMLQIVDAQWKDHLYSLDHLKEGIGLRGYGQRDPLVEYKKESFDLFRDMRGRVDEEMVRYLWWLRPVVSEEAAGRMRRPAPRRQPPLILNDPASALAGGFGSSRGSAAAVAEPVAASPSGRRPSPRASAATTRSRRCGATCRRWAATTRARAAAARSTRSATGPPVMGDMDLTTAPSALDLGTAFATALTFDDVLLVPQHSRSCRRRWTSPRASPATSR